MKKAGQIVLLSFPQTDLDKGKLRPALLLSKLPGEYDDWLIVMVSSQIQHVIPDFDEVVRETDSDFADSGLKKASLIRLSRLVVGHNLTPDEIQPGDISYRDTLPDGSIRLRLGCDTVISSGYAHMSSGDETPEEIIDEVVTNLRKVLYSPSKK